MKDEWHLNKQEIREDIPERNNLVQTHQVVKDIRTTVTQREDGGDPGNDAGGW